MTQKLTFTTLRNLRMGLPIGAVSPIDFGKYQGCYAFVIENDATYRISNKSDELSKARGNQSENNYIVGTDYVNGAPVLKKKALTKEVRNER